MFIVHTLYLKNLLSHKHTSPLDISEKIELISGVIT